MESHSLSIRLFLVNFDLWRQILKLLTLQDLATLASTFNYNMIALLAQPRILPELEFPHTLEEPWKLRFLLKTLRTVDTLILGRVDREYPIWWPKDLLPMLRELQPTSLTLSYLLNFRAHRSNAALDPQVPLSNWFPTLTTLKLNRFWFSTEDSFYIFTRKLPKSLTSLSIVQNRHWMYAAFSIFKALCNLPTGLMHLSVTAKIFGSWSNSSMKSPKHLDYVLQRLPKLQSLELDVDGTFWPDELQIPLPGELLAPVLFSPTPIPANPPFLTFLKLRLPLKAFQTLEVLHLPKSLIELVLSTNNPDTPHDSGMELSFVWPIIMKQIANLPHLQSFKIHETGSPPTLSFDRASSFISFLPAASLTRLAVKMHWIDLTKLGVLLSSLVNLQVYEEICTPSEDSHRPATFDNTRTVTDSQTLILPPTLTQIRCYSVVFIESMLPMLPSKLQRLHAPFLSLKTLCIFITCLPLCLFEPVASHPIKVDLPLILEGVTRLDLVSLDAAVRKVTCSRVFGGTLELFDTLPSSVTELVVVKHNTLPTCGMKLDYSDHWLAKHKSLTSLTCCDEDFSLSLLPMLPNLLHFNWRASYNDILDIKHLPSQLKTFKCSTFVVASTASMMPISLLTFHTSQLTLQFVENHIRKTLTDLSFQPTNLRAEEVERVCLHLPALTRLSIRPYRLDITSKYLPESLELVTEETLKTETKAFFVRSFLKIPQSDWDHLFLSPCYFKLSLDRIPINAKHLIAGSQLHLEPRMELPASLQTVTLAKLPVQTLPNSLTSVNILQETSPTQPIESYFKALPASVTSFRFTKDSDEVASSPPILWTSIPSHLQRLTLENYTLMPPAPSDNPKNYRLKSLTCPGGPSWDENALLWLNEIPLTELKLDHISTNGSSISQKITEIHTWSVILNPLHAKFPMLDPQHVTELRCKFPDSVNSICIAMFHVPDSSIAPHSLHLSPRINNIFPLPYSLRSLTILATPAVPSGFRLNDLWINLPRDLLHLSLHIPSHIEGVFGEDLPPAIVTVELLEVRGKVTLKNLPSTVSTFRAPKLVIRNTSALPLGIVEVYPSEMRKGKRSQGPEK